MMTTSSDLFLVALAFIAPAVQSLGPGSALAFPPERPHSRDMDVDTFRGRGDPDYTLAFIRAMAFAGQHPGTRFLLNCNSSSSVGTYFTITSGFRIPSQTTLEATSRTACFINFAPSLEQTPQPFIIDLTGSESVTIRDLTVHSYSHSAPKVGLLLERNKTDGAAGHHVIENVTVDGLFRIAPVYSISSEENLWISDTFAVRGGGAGAAFYTSASDQYGVCQSLECQKGASSNLSLWMFGCHLVNTETGGSGVTDVLEATGVGDHSYNSLYISLPRENPGVAAGFLFVGPRENQGTNSSVQVLSTRVEHGAYLARFVNDSRTNSGTISRLAFRDNTFDSAYARHIFSAAEGVTIDASRFSNNSASGTPANSSEFDRVTKTSFDEDYGTLTIRHSAGGNRYVGTTQLSPGAPKR